MKQRLSFDETKSFPPMKQKFPTGETKVSCWGNKSFPLMKQKFPCGLMFLVDHFTAYFQIRLTQLILIF
ncbi:hypothetical protein, partial [Bacteroides pyogenes]|uniref:hypothetical protein n=1 Tax=Bacteroides pyogenes TaxID=310300 RepID=UPI001F4600FA